MRILACDRAWSCLFPQHGPGRKHARPIVLADWQQEIVCEHPGRFLRGLIHSDGWRRSQPRPGQGAGLRVSALPVLEPVGRHQAHLHRHLRPDGHRLAVLGALAHLGRPAATRSRSFDEHVGPKS